MTHEGQKGELSACAGGTCSLFNCDASRGPVECVNGKCQCGSTKFCFGWYSHVLDRGGGQFVGSLLLDVLPLRLLVAEANRDTVLIQVVHAFRSMTLFPTTVTEPQHGTASWFGHETSCFANSHVSYSAMDCWAVRASEIKRSIACSIPAYCHLGFEMAMWPCNPRICGCVVVILPTNGSGFGAAHGCNSHVEKIRRFSVSDCPMMRKILWCYTHYNTYWKKARQRKTCSNHTDAELSTDSPRRRGALVECWQLEHHI